MSNAFRRDFETDEQYRQRLEREPVEGAADQPAKAVAPQLPQIVIKPGSHHARRAYGLGMEDEYSDRMKARYGGEW